MKFTITSIVTFDADDQLLNDYLKENNITIEEYKNNSINNIKEIWKYEIGKEMKNVLIDVNMESE